MKKVVFFFLFTLIHSLGCWFTLGGLYNFLGCWILVIFLGKMGPFLGQSSPCDCELWNPDMRKKTSKKQKIHTFYSFVAIIKGGLFTYLFIHLILKIN